MIDIKKLKPEYTLLEISKLLLLSKDKVSGDFRRQIFCGEFKVMTFEHSRGNYKKRTRKMTRVIPLNEVLRYIKYLRIKKQLTVDI